MQLVPYQMILVNFCDVCFGGEQARKKKAKGEVRRGGNIKEGKESV